MSRGLSAMIVTLLFILCPAKAVSSYSGPKEKPFTVVIDAGHGGKDIGCRGKTTNEKTITLDVAKRLGNLIEQNHPEVKQVFTRKNDTYLTLDQRAKVANDAKGDLFISIHVNSVDYKNKNRKNVKGASVYTLGLHKTGNNLAVAMRENSVMALDDNYHETYSGFDPNSSESYIIFELSQNEHLARSLEFADNAQRELVNHAGREDKNVRQAGFWVLWATSMPAVLVELDFICNPEVENFLSSDNGKDLMAEALSNAFDSYYSHNGPLRGASVKADSRTPETVSDNKNPERQTQKDSVTPASQADDSGSSFHIQICSVNALLPSSDKLYKTFGDLNYYRDGEIYKYYTGSFNSLETAKKELFKIKKSFPQAFIIKLNGGRRVNF